MPKAPREVAGFIALPVTLKTSTHPHQAKHYIYIKPHEPRIADEDAPRSLFLVNIPVLTSEAHIRHLFAAQLEAGRIERVEFSENENDVGRSSTLVVSSTNSSKKRKRMTAEELEAGLDAFPLPRTLQGQLHATGATAIAVFVDKPSMEMSLKAAKRATKQGTEIIWGAGLNDTNTTLSLGLKRYEAHKSLQYPTRATLLRLADNFMTAYAELEEARARENAKRRQIPDEDGFVTVTRGTKGGVLRKDEADELKIRQKNNNKGEGLEDFYRFQMREKRRERQGELLRKFEEDKRRVAEMKVRRGRMKPES